FAYPGYAWVHVARVSAAHPGWFVSGVPMSRAYNFSAGPATLPESVLEQARDTLPLWRDTGASVLELSHRGPDFMEVAEEAEADLRRLLAIPDDHAVLFLTGGATTQQALIALNFAA